MSAPPSPMAVVELLERIEELGEDATGALKVGGNDAGMVLVESGRICWAVSTRMRRRMTDLICDGGDVDRQSVERIFRDCRESGTPLGEALVDSGVLTEEGLHDALLHHTVEAIGRLGSGKVERFVPHRNHRYDARFSYSPCELLAYLGEALMPELHQSAVQELERVVGHDGVGVAFGRPVEISTIVPVGILNAELVTVRKLMELGRWAAQLSDIAGAIDDRAHMSCATTSEGSFAFAWRYGEEIFAGFAPDQASLARALFRRQRDGG